MKEQIRLIKIEMIDRPGKMAREQIDPEKVRELAESIRENGLLEPVILRPSNGRFEMVAGDRRFLAHKFLDLKEIKAIVKDLSDRDVIFVRAIENLQRVNLTPKEEGRIYLMLREEEGLTFHQIAKTTGRALSWVQRLLKFIKFPEFVQEAVSCKEISLAVAETLMEIEDEVFLKYYLNMAIVGGASEKTARLFVDSYLESKAGTYYDGEGTDPNTSEGIESKPTFMTCESCHSPVEIHKIRNVAVCPDCVKKVRHT